MLTLLWVYCTALALTMYTRVLTYTVPFLLSQTAPSTTAFGPGETPYRTSAVSSTSI